MQVVGIVPITLHCMKGVSVWTPKHILRRLRGQRRCLLPGNYQNFFKSFFYHLKGWMMVISFRGTCESVWIIIVNCASMFAYPSTRTFFLVFWQLPLFLRRPRSWNAELIHLFCFFSREGRKRGERHDRGGRGNVPKLSASVRQS